MLFSKKTVNSCFFRSYVRGFTATSYGKQGVAPVMHNGPQKRFKGGRRVMSAKQRASQDAAVERAKEQESLLHEDLGAAMSMENIQLETEFSIDKYTEEQVLSFFNTEDLEIHDRYNSLLERDLRVGDVCESLEPAKRISRHLSDEALAEGDLEEQMSQSPTGHLSAKEMFEDQIGYDEKLAFKEREEETRSFVAGDRKLLNEPVFSDNPMRPMLNKVDEEYKRYLKKNKLNPYAEYAYYNNELFNEKDDVKKFQSFNMPQDSPLKDIEFTDEDRVEMYKAAQAYVAQKFVDKPNQNFQHLYAPNAPLFIDNEDLGKIFIFSNEDYQKYFPSGVGGQLDEVFDTICQRALMVRPPVIPVIQQLGKMTQVAAGARLEPHENKRGFVFTGSRGSGKSSLLATVVHSAFKQGLLVFHIPSLRQWTHGVHYAEPSPLLKGFFDLPTPEKTFLKQFQSANSDILKQMMLTKDYDLPLEVGQKKPNTLFDLITYGISLETNVPVVFKLLLDELLENNTVPTLFAIDDYNLLNDTTGFSYGNLDQLDTMKLRPIHGSELTLTRGIERIIHANKPNHLVVGANCMKYPTRKKLDFEEEVLDILHVPRYTYLELCNICEYYMSAYWVFVKPETFIQDMIFTTGGNPRLVWQEMSLV